MHRSTVATDDGRELLRRGDSGRFGAVLEQEHVHVGVGLRLA
jgi:hypothetical protein